MAVCTVHACAVSMGEVYCWGVTEDSTEYGGLENRPGVSQNGPGSDINWTSTPNRVTGLRNIVSVDAGRSGTCAVDGDGRAWCNVFGEPGSGQINDIGSTTPV